MTPRAYIPDPQLYWDEATRYAHRRLQHANDRTVASPSTPNLEDLLEAQRAFGRCLLALDRTRRPEVYEPR